MIGGGVCTIGLCMSGGYLLAVLPAFMCFLVTAAVNVLCCLYFIVYFIVRVLCCCVSPYSPCHPAVYLKSLISLVSMRRWICSDVSSIGIIGVADEFLNNHLGPCRQFLA